MNYQNQRSNDINSSESMGQFGNFPVDSTTKIFNPKHKFSVIEVKAGTCTIDKGKQDVVDPRDEYPFPDWDGIVLEVGIHIVNLSVLTVTTTGLTVVWYAQG